MGVNKLVNVFQALPADLRDKFVVREVKSLDSVNKSQAAKKGFFDGDKILACLACDKVYAEHEMTPPPIRSRQRCCCLLAIQWIEVGIQKWRAREVCGEFVISRNGTQW